MKMLIRFLPVLFLPHGNPPSASSPAQAAGPPSAVLGHRPPHPTARRPSHPAAHQPLPIARRTPPPAGRRPSHPVMAELKEVMRARKKAETPEGGAGWWAGMVQEMSEIEWLTPGKVVGTTGVVLGVIASSNVALLSMNALLAELYDHVFASRGLQDFFG